MSVKEFRKIVVGLIALAVVGIAPGQASAATITLTDLGTVSANGNGVLISDPSVVTLTSSSNAPISQGGNLADGYDPWGAGDGNQIDTNSYWMSIGGCCAQDYLSAQQPFTPFATFSFKIPETTFSLLWGSPNTGNLITLYNGTAVIATVAFNDSMGYVVDGSILAGWFGAHDNMTPGNIIAITSSEAFTSATLTNTAGGFEVADISATPLPSTWTMMLMGVAGLGFVAHRGMKRRSAEAAVA